MKKSFLKRILGFGLAVLATVSMTACGGNSGKQDKDDPNKTNIHVFDYKAGYGDRWLQNLKTAFEAKYANESFEEGKTGVLVHIEPDMRDFNSAQIKNSGYEVFFFENANYYSYVNDGALENISDVVNGKAADSESKTILEKLDEQQIDYFGSKSGDNTNFYALPSYYGNYGIIYNIDLFNEKGYYIADDKTDGITIIGNDKTAKKAAGPDGEYGTEDDGLPATYEEFFALCDEIYNYGDTPACWPGKYNAHHLGNLMDNLVSDYEGVEQMRLNYTFNGEATDLVVLDDDGKVTFNENGTPKTESKTITTANGYDVGRQLGKYYAMNFIERLISNTNYYTSDSFKLTYTHTDNQQDYLQSGASFGSEKTIAMLIDGPWWQEEANDVFTAMAKKDSKYSRTNRNFGWMPLPKATADKVGTGNVYSDYLNAFVSVKSGLSDGLKRACKEFVRFSASDEMLKDFTLTTGAVKAYKYDMGSDYDKLSTFSKGLVSYIQNADVVYKFSSSSFYNSNIANLKYDVVYSAKVNGNLYKNAINGIREGKASGQGYFEAFNKYFKDYSFWK